MPYEWLETPTQGATAELHAWPHRSLPRRGFVWFIAMTATGLAVPLLPVVGSPILWGLLPFVLVALWGLWWALRRSYRDAQVIEVLKIWPDRLLLEQRRQGYPARSFETNPYWLRANLSGEGPVEDYLTLRGGPREVELGAFLTPPERRNLCADVQRRLKDLR